MVIEIWSYWIQKMYIPRCYGLANLLDQQSLLLITLCLEYGLAYIIKLLRLLGFQRVL